MRLGAHGGGQGLGHIVSPCTQLVTDANDRQTSDSIIASCTNLGGGRGINRISVFHCQNVIYTTCVKLVLICLRLIAIVHRN